MGSARLQRFVLGLVVCLGLACLCGLPRAADNLSVSGAPQPPAACPMIPAQLLADIVPDHAQPQEDEQPPGDPWVRVSSCVVLGTSSSLDVGLTSFGRSPQHGPIQAARNGMLRPLNRPIYQVERLGDESWYFLEGPDAAYPLNIHLMTRTGSLVIQIRYERGSATHEALVRSASLVTRELLSRL